MNLEIENKNQIENNLNIVKEQNNFLNTTLWKTIDNGIDIGLRYLLPDFIENQIIDLKNNLINYGLKDGVKKSINEAINLGKSAIGIATGNFENVSQIESAIKKGGIIDSVSMVIDSSLNKAVKKGKVDKNVAGLIKNGKNSILNNVEKNIESTLNKQIRAAQNIDNHIKNWQEFYNKHDFNNMEKEYKIIKTELKDLVPIENTINNARIIEGIHELLKSRENKFEISEDEVELMEKLN